MSVLSGRHLYPGIKKGSHCNPFVRIEVFGCPIDVCYGVTKICAHNAFNPTWDETFNLGIVHIPSLSVVRVSVHDSRKKGNELMYQTTLPVDYLRSGIRCIRMRNKFGVFENGLASLLVYVKIDAKDEKKKANTPSGSKDLSTMMAEFSHLEKRKNRKRQKNRQIATFIERKFWMIISPFFRNDAKILNINQRWRIRGHWKATQRVSRCHFTWIVTEEISDWLKYLGTNQLPRFRFHFNRRRRSQSQRNQKWTICPKLFE